MMKKLAAILLLTLGFVYDMSAQCSLCRAQLENNKEETSSLAEGLNNGILYLMIIPYIIFFFLFRKKIIKFFKELGKVYD